MNYASLCLLSNNLMLFLLLVLEKAYETLHVIIFSGYAYRIHLVTVEKPLNRALLVGLILSAALNAVLLIGIVYSKNKDRVITRIEPSERTDFEIEIEE